MQFLATPFSSFIHYFILISVERFLSISIESRPTMHAVSRHGTPSLKSLPKDDWIQYFQTFFLNSKRRVTL